MSYTWRFREPKFLNTIKDAEAARFVKINADIARPGECLMCLRKECKNTVPLRCYGNEMTQWSLLCNGMRMELVNRRRRLNEIYYERQEELEQLEYERQLRIERENRRERIKRGNQLLKDTILLHARKMEATIKLSSNLLAKSMRKLEEEQQRLTREAEEKVRRAYEIDMAERCKRNGKAIDDVFAYNDSHPNASPEDKEIAHAIILLSAFPTHLLDERIAKLKELQIERSMKHY